MRIRATLIEMASSEIMSIVDPRMYSAIKKSDPKPHFKAFVVGHEGESSGRVSIDGSNFVSVVKRWYRSAIEMMHEKIRLGIALFRGHTWSNEENNGRLRIGEVVGKKLQEIKGVLSEIIIAYIYPEFRDQELDVASIEADIILNDDQGVYSAEVENVSGIALGNSKTEKPGFAGASLLGIVQEFTDNKSSQLKRSMEMGIESIGDLREIIKTNGWKPGDIFSLTDLTDDPSVKGVIKSEVKEAVAGEWSHRARTDDKFKSESEKWENEKKEFESQIKALKGEASKVKLTDLWIEEKKSRKFDEKEVAFIEKKIPEFTPEDPEMIEKEFSKFLDKKYDEFNDLAEVFGVKKAEKKEEDGNGGGEGGGSDEDPLKDNIFIPD